MRNLKFLFILLAYAIPYASSAQMDTTVFTLLDLGRPGLEETAKFYNQGDLDKAASALLEYYRDRKSVVHPDIDPYVVEITDEEQKWADDGLKHIFFVHYGYQPSFFYGDDIDWMYWPVKDNELRWQLHRTKWWVPMGKAYRVSGDEKYACEWMAQYVDWMEKNPLIKGEGFSRETVSSGEINYGEAKDEISKLIENMRFAWRPLEVSDRLEFQIRQFAYFIQSPSITPDFITHFLVNYHRHAEHIMGNFSKSGNHLLFEAQRLTYAGVYFPEYKDATVWRKAGVDILNREIEKQVYDDGMQYELDPHYHLEAINIFFNALRMMDANGYRGEFPSGYLDKVHNMIVVWYNITFPDYTNPIFSDAKRHDKEFTLPYYKNWAEVFPDDPMIVFMSTEGRSGHVPNYLSKAFKTSGFYVLRNGWCLDATVMVLKAGPTAFWHNQPDNGTFELWRKGRNFFPDSGSFVYAGDKEIMDLRNWFRRTKSHNTLTLDNKDIPGMDSKCVYWSTSGNTDIVVYENPSYEGLSHRRSVFFVDREFYVIVDEAYGDAKGEVGINYHLSAGDLEKEFKTDINNMSVETLYDDDNNIKLQVFGSDRMKMEKTQGWVSEKYRYRDPRPSYYFYADKKDDSPVRFITVIMPSGHKKTVVKAKFNSNYDLSGVNAEVTINKKRYNLQYKY